MATETSGDRAAQCSVPNITFSNESSKEPSRSGGPTTPNTPVVLLAKPRDTPSSVAQAAIADVAPISLLQRPSSAPTSMISPSSSTSSPSNISAAKQPETANLDVDTALVEALKSSKDRLYVLKLGETMESLIGQGKLYAKVELQPASSYQRLLVHRCADFYHLTQESSPSSVAVIVTSDSRIPSKRIADLVPPEETVLPAFQIMRRVDRSKAASRATSVDGNLTDDGDESNRSQGSGSKKKHMTIEEREAAYHKARSRIFMDFEEKDASTSSTGAISSAASTVSFTGGSTGMSSVDGDGASTAPTESEYSAPVGRGKDSWYAGSFNSNNGRSIQNNGMTHASTTLRSTAPPFTSPNVAPPPPKGTVHYLPPIPDTNTHSDMTASHPQQVPPNGVPAGGYPPYPQPAIYPYYVPYFYPMPYPQPVASQSPPSQPNNAPPDAQRPEHQAAQPTAPPGYPPHLPPPVPGQPYPGYVWLPAPPGYMPVPSLAAQPAGMGMQPPPPPSQPSRPASQASHQSHTSYDQRSQHSLPQQPPAPQQHPQGNPYGSHPPPPHAFQQPHVNAGVPMVLPNGPPPQNPMDSRHSGPVPINSPPFGHHSGVPTQPPPSGNGPWNNQYPPPNQGGPNSNNMMAPRPNAAGRGALPPPAGPGRPQNVVDASRSAPNAGTSIVPGNGKRGMPRNAWGAYSYGPGVGVGGMHTTNVPPSGPPLPTGPIGPAGGVLRAPDGLNIRILPPITIESHSTGSSNGSSSSLRKRNVNAAVGVIKPPGDETSSVTSSTSSSSKRTFTSTASSQPQHHPLPERPDWVLGNRPQPGGAPHNRPRGTPSVNTNTRQLLQPSPGGLFNQSTTPSPVNGPSAIPSSSSSISGSDSLSKEFPPLNPGGSSSQGQTSRSRTPASPAGAWNNVLVGGAVRPGSAGVSSSPSRPGSTNVPSTLVPPEGRLEEPDNKKFERPPPKNGASLFNPRVPGSSRSKSSDRAALSSSVDSLSQSLEAASIVDQKAEDTTVRMDGDGRTDEASSGSGTSYAGTTDISSVDGTGRRISVEI